MAVGIILLGPVSLPAAGLASVPIHTATWAYDDSTANDACNGGYGAPASLVRRWLTYAETNCGSWTVGGTPKAITDCHANGIVYCKVMPYVDSFLVYRGAAPNGLLSDPSESWFLHEPVPNQYTRVTTGIDGGGYAMNQESASYQSWWRNYINASFPGADGLFMDDQEPYMPFYGLSSTAGYEIAGAGQLQAAHEAMSNALTKPNGTLYPQVDNTIPDCGNPYENEQGIGPTGNMLAAPVIGLLAEGCPISDGTITSWYPDLLDDMAYIDHLGHGFTVLLPYGTAATGDSASVAMSERSRRVTEATVLLAYEPARVVVWPDLEQGSRDLAVWPEEGIYPTVPVQSMSSPSGSGCLQGASGESCPFGGHNDLGVPGQPGVYRREFRTCYNQGQLFGACAAIVNDTGSWLAVQSSWLSQTYTSVITFNIPANTTGDVQSGATISTAAVPFVPAMTVIAPYDAELLAGAPPGPPGITLPGRSASARRFEGIWGPLPGNYGEGT